MIKSSWNFVHPAGHARSVRQSLSRYVPWWAFWISIDAALAEKRADATAGCRAYFLRDAKDAGADNATPTAALDEGVVTAAWLEVLGRLNAEFAADEQLYLCGTPYPTAADFGVRPFAPYSSFSWHNCTQLYQFNIP
jgi:hypothetical protein